MFKFTGTSIFMGVEATLKPYSNQEPFKAHRKSGCPRSRGFRDLGVSVTSQLLRARAPSMRGITVLRLRVRTPQETRRRGKGANAALGMTPMWNVVTARPSQRPARTGHPHLGICYPLPIHESSHPGRAWLLQPRSRGQDAAARVRSSVRSFRRGFRPR